MSGAAAVAIYSRRENIWDLDKSSVAPESYLITGENNSRPFDLKEIKGKKVALLVGGSKEKDEMLKEFRKIQHELVASVYDRIIGYVLPSQLNSTGDKINGDIATLSALSSAFDVISYGNNGSWILQSMRERSQRPSIRTLYWINQPFHRELNGPLDCQSCYIFHNQAQIPEFPENCQTIDYSLIDDKSGPIQIGELIAQRVLHQFPTANQSRAIQLLKNNNYTDLKPIESNPKWGMIEIISLIFIVWKQFSPELINSRTQ